MDQPQAETSSDKQGRGIGGRKRSRFTDPHPKKPAVWQEKNANKTGSTHSLRGGNDKQKSQNLIPKLKSKKNPEFFEDNPGWQMMLWSNSVRYQITSHFFVKKRL